MWETFSGSQCTYKRLTSRDACLCQIFSTGGTSQWQQASEISGKWVRRRIDQLPSHSLHTGEAVPGSEGQKSCQTAEGAGAAWPQGALQSGHFGAAH